MHIRILLILQVAVCLITGNGLKASTGTRASQVTGGNITFTISEPASPAKDQSLAYLTVVYLKNTAVPKIGGNTTEVDVNWLLSKGYRVVELDYAGHANAKSPTINADIITINDDISAGSFCGLTNCSKYRSWVLFDGYRIARDVPYFKDNPTVYNYPSNYTVGDTLRMDIIYPANAATKVPAVLSFSYSNSYYGAPNNNQRLNLGNTLAGFNDSFLEGAPASGIAWVIADHPKYCPWGNGKPTGGANDTYKSYQVNPDAAQKVKSAVRTLRALGENLGLSGKIGIYGFSRGSDAGSMAVGDRTVPEFENAGFNQGVSDEVQAAALGSGVFDFTKIFLTTGDGDGNLETRCPWAWGTLASNYATWEKQGSAYLTQTNASAPVLFFYNTDDAGYYQKQIGYFKHRLDSLGVPVTELKNYGTGHAVPQTSQSLSTMYAFFSQYLKDSIASGLKEVTGQKNLIIIPDKSKEKIRVMFNMPEAGNYKLELFDIQGKSIFQTKKQAQAGKITEILQLNTIQPGLYLIKADFNQHSSTEIFQW